ncbi:MAG: glycosyltransferase family 2 protein, partial [Gammaproteobacteria bacterium]
MIVTMTEMNRVTIIMTQRERFDLVKRSIESLYRATSVPFNLIYVDGGASPEIRHQSEALALRHGFKIVRREYFLPPNMARNLALNTIEQPTTYIVYVDNDVIFEGGWLDALVQCADETGAALVTPLIMIGNPERPETVRIHFAGGKIDIKETPEGVQFFDSHNYGDQKLCEVKASLQRQVSDTVEFHTVLVRSDLMERVGPLDEDLRA